MRAPTTLREWWRGGFTGGGVELYWAPARARSVGQAADRDGSADQVLDGDWPVCQPVRPDGSVGRAPLRAAVVCQPAGRGPPARRVPVSGVCGASVSGATGGPVYSLVVPGSVGSGRALRRTGESSTATERARPREPA
ncbi:hypothetical protein [Kribbella solani]|uniref:hypothetical protein n=1 Tax=Kribbella solani TaxID=236067 RepID=UPI0029A2261A|nr:hypothetical protein [Kribbella solani]MDX2968535.1 hypothetical protein [Kribbella solani]